MMMSITSAKNNQSIIIAVILFACFTAILYVYYEPTTSWFKCPAAPIHMNNVTAEICLSVFKMQNYTHIENNTCTVNFILERQQMTTTKTTKQVTTAKRDDPDTIILIWMWPFGYSFGFGPCSSAFNIQGCRLTDDKELYNQAHAVWFHHRDIKWDLSNMPKLPRPAFQKWIWMNMESPANSPQIPQLKDLFNLTSSYRRDSDVQVPYGWLSEATIEEKKYTIPQKDKLVCWIVSNYNSHHKRSYYYTELSKYIHVEAFGGHFNRRINGDEYSNVVSSCKFYLSFENSIHRDYITEKLYNPLLLGTVPVVLGPPRENYEQFIPSKAFIHVVDFPSPKELADHLNFMDQNENMYRQYFTWREHFVSRASAFGLEHACRACEHIRKNKNYRVVKDLNSWYFS
ncbi:4-galactosyl-N-acetylglucosaminide 3-alpha-L-fucosyltransferase 9-like [Myxocyprinus asiaticus]|uniref:4-galactosyl-N-acetylglucosaminide 3-alpha-L-fucosyltransferase 9-like n=1 Tax=Myxocyprinus asiaticus TaxID=70543 RepID=UPI0022232833|nr:4-galactosyl-N-acetylglucosaminide 3-alpha-L-fucosyltransferase 9-like [Myxocyprinus asiaticus]XP_051519577.1 4-galactosyl-N-acetylglucosaminide 3-alpha-L-fucosyltransferase 9-like [Myxocyprinus asiaticus]XP_051519578.1 4-galactosyl-N-acetylglucosaminide 3-alpha-L-fucosyltransferase 9-like [Myxocyprinus asiaticus]